MKTKKSPKKPRSAQPENGALRVRQQSLELLATELYQIVIHGLTLYGLPIERQRALFKRTRPHGATARRSDELLDEFHQLGDLLTTWLQELPYINTDGTPRVLPIRGRGATFESLARQFLPQSTLNQVIKLACRIGSTTTVAGGKIAVHGDPMIDLARSPETALAQSILHIRQIIATCQHNVVAKKTATGPKRPERLVVRLLTPEQFEIFEKEIRPLIDNLCQQADRLLERKEEKGNKQGRSPAGIGLYVYFDQVPPKRGSTAKKVARRRTARSRP